MSIGEAWKGFMGTMDKEQAFELMDAFVEAGGNFIDSANNCMSFLSSIPSSSFILLPFPLSPSPLPFYEIVTTVLTPS
jgi:hypothetical protein